MELKPGHKPTEVGAIPNDWDVASFKEQFNISAGGDVNLKLSVAEKDDIHPYPIYSNALTNGGLYGYCSYADHPAGSITITARGTLGVAAYRDHKYTAIGRVLVLEPRQDTFGKFFAEFINSSVRFAIESTGVPQLTAPQIGRYLLAVPPYHEQRAIAAVLNDVNALLDGLNRLIAKKRDLKRATMQQLLTGQTHLPGCRDEWRVTRLGDYVTFLRNGVNSRAELLPEGRVKYVHYGDVHACKDVYLSTASLPCLPDPKAASLDRLLPGDVIFADASEDLGGVSKSVEVREVGSTEVVSGLHTIAARFDKEVLADGFKGFLQFCPPFATHLRRLAAGTKVYATNRAHIAGVEMPLPPVREQAEIATVLSDMDAEIAALEARRDKTLDLKQAMMQELFTGKTRLVQPEVAHA